MSVRNFLHGYDEIDTKGKFISTKLIIDILKREFRIHILEESPMHIKCKINRGISGTASPVRFPNSTLDIAWGKPARDGVITYRLTCYDYYVVAAGAIIFAILCTNYGHSLAGSIKIGLLVFVAVMLLFGGLVFLDTKYLMYRIRKTLLSMIA